MKPCRVIRGPLNCWRHLQFLKQVNPNEMKPQGGLSKRFKVHTYSFCCVAVLVFLERTFERPNWL